MKMAAVLARTLSLLAPGMAWSAGEPVSFAYSQLGLLAHLRWSVALGQKYFEEQGLEPKGFNFEGGGQSINALIGGSADFAANALEHAMRSGSSSQAGRWTSPAPTTWRSSGRR